MSELEDIIGCKIKRDLANMTLKISQTHLITQMTQGFNRNIKSLMTLNAIDTSHKGFLGSRKTYTKRLKNIQKQYRSSIVSLLYLVKKLQPELSNTIFELSKYLDEEIMIRYKALLRTIRYIIDTKYYFY